MIPTQYLITEERKKEERKERIMWAVIIAVITVALILLVDAGIFAGKAIAHFLETLEAVGW